MLYLVNSSSSDLSILLYKLCTAVFTVLQCCTVLNFNQFLKLWSFYKIKWSLHFIFIWKIGFYRFFDWNTIKQSRLLLVFCIYDKTFSSSFCIVKFKKTVLKHIHTFYMNKWHFCDENCNIYDYKNKWKTNADKN